MTAAMELPELLANLQFPDIEPSSVHASALLHAAINLLPRLQYASEIASVARMIVLSPAIWLVDLGAQDDSSIRTGLLVLDTFRTVVSARLKIQALTPNYRSADDDLRLFCLALTQGIQSCDKAYTGKLCALAGILAAVPNSGFQAVQRAYVATLNDLAAENIVLPDLSLSISATIGYGYIPPNLRRNIRPSQTLVSSLLVVLFAQNRGPQLSKYAGHISRFVGQLFQILASTNDVATCAAPLDIILTASNHFRAQSDAKEVLFAVVAVLTGVVDGIQRRSTRSWPLFGSRSDAVTLNCATTILLTLRNLATATYTISLAGFEAESYLLSATIGILVSSRCPDLNRAIDILHSTITEQEKLFFLNTTEKIFLSVSASPVLSPDLLSRLLHNVKCEIANAPLRLATGASQISQAVYEASHAVFLASLQIPALALQNVGYIQEDYLLRVVALFKSKSIIEKQFDAAIHCLAVSVAPGSGVLYSAAPHFASNHLLPVLQSLNRELRNPAMTRLFVDALLTCVSVDEIGFWLDDVQAFSGVVAEKVKSGDVPAVCADGVIQWWFDPSSRQRRNSESRL
ncbi:uncharacterized protein V1518DRAFT_408343 [Limtongia smithiae]|uniref:uncharacterized protein n=1 Tax=Limtongia smithiae TaxID=1125753 RepID=UPI0034CEB483